MCLIYKKEQRSLGKLADMSMPMYERRGRGAQGEEVGRAWLVRTPEQEPLDSKQYQDRGHGGASVNERGDDDGHDDGHDDATSVEDKHIP